jgi:purine-binding chemotaxis protein CheW
LINRSDKFVLFTLNNQQIALHLSDVEKITRVAEITTMPNTPDVVMGVINVHGRIIPVVNLRKRFHLDEREISIDDHFIVVRTSNRSMALWVDYVRDIIEIQKEDVVEHDSILPNVEYFEGVVKLNENIILIQDLEKFISLEEEQQLDAAMTQTAKEKEVTTAKTEKEKSANAE